MISPINAHSNPKFVDSFHKNFLILTPVQEIPRLFPDFSRNEKFLDISQFTRSVETMKTLAINGEEYEFLKTLSFGKLKKTMKNPTYRTPILRKSRLKSLVTSQLIRLWYEP